MDWKVDRIASAHRGENPMVIAKLKSGFAAIGDTQFLPGYCVLLPFKKVNTLNDLKLQQRSEYLLDMSIIGDAIQAVCHPRRINYSIYGNTDTYLHAHIFPRYDWEPEERIPYPVWQYPANNWSDPQYQYSEERHHEIREELSKKLEQLINEAY